MQFIWLSGISWFDELQLRKWFSRGIVGLGFAFPFLFSGFLRTGIWWMWQAVLLAGFLTRHVALETDLTLNHIEFDTSFCVSFSHSVTHTVAYFPSGHSVTHRVAYFPSNHSTFPELASFNSGDVTLIPPMLPRENFSQYIAKDPVRCMRLQRVLLSFHTAVVWSLKKFAGISITIFSGIISVRALTQLLRCSVWLLMFSYKLSNPIFSAFSFPVFSFITAVLHIASVWTAISLIEGLILRAWRDFTETTGLDRWDKQSLS